MTEQAAKPWFGKKCANCDAPINYAYKGHVIGWCGKCTDQLRGLFKDDLRREIEKELQGGSGAAPSRGGAGKAVAALVMGLVVGLGGALATAAFAPASWAQLVGAVAPRGK